MQIRFIKHDMLLLFSCFGLSFIRHKFRSMSLEVRENDFKVLSCSSLA